MSSSLKPIPTSPPPPFPPNKLSQHRYHLFLSLFVAGSDSPFDVRGKGGFESVSASKKFSFKYF